MKPALIKSYARALAELAAEKLPPAEEKKVVERFMQLLTEKGLAGQAGSIASLAEEYLLESQGHHTVVLETAREMTPAQRKSALRFAGPQDRVQEKVTPELLAGIRITIDGKQQLDYSARRKIDTMFQTI